MEKPRGIIYGTPALFKFLAAYPNGRLMALGAFLIAVMPWPLVGSALTMHSLAIKLRDRRLGDAAILYDRTVTVVILASLFSGVFLLAFASLGIAMSFRRQQAHPAPNPAPEKLAT